MIDYNIHYTTNKKGKKIARFAYKKPDGKTAYLQAPSKAALNQKIENTFKERGFIKTHSQEITLNEARDFFVKSHLNYKMSLGKTALSTIDDYGSFYRCHIDPFFKNKDLRLMNKKDVIDFVEHLKEKQLDGKTITKIFNHFKNIVSYSADKGRLDYNVTKDINYLTDIFTTNKKRKKIDLDFWNFEVMQQLIYNIDNPMIKLICMILLETAARPSEVRALERSDLLFMKSNSLQINIDKAVKRHKKVGETKTEQGERIVDISASLKDHITDYVNSLPVLQNKLFINTKAKYICVERIIRAINKAFKKMQPEYQDFPIQRKSYAFRHYRTTYFAAKGKFKNALDLAHYIGDKDINFVNRTYIAPFKNGSSSKEFKETITWN